MPKVGSSKAVPALATPAIEGLEFRPMRLLAACFASLLLQCGPALAQDNFAIVHIDSGNQQKMIYLQRVSAAACRKAIDTFFSAVRVDCASCKIDASSCTTDLDPTFKMVWNHQRSIAPYLSSDNHRIVFLGRSRDELKAQCAEVAKAYVRAGKAARCID